MLVLSRKVDEWIQIGDDLFVGPTDIDAKGVRLLAHGRMLGGPEDGAGFKKAQEVALGGEMRIGPHVVVTVVDIRGEQARFGLVVPASLTVHRKEVVDAAKKAREDER